jgi:hypothetical protein
LPVHEDGATNVFGFGGGCVDGSFGGVAGLLCLPRFAFNGGGSSSTGFGGLASFGVFFAMSNFVLPRLRTMKNLSESQERRGSAVLDPTNLGRTDKRRVSPR